MNSQDFYRSRLGTLAGALSLIKSGDCIGVSFYGNEPTSFLQNLHTIAENISDVTIWSGRTMWACPFMSDPTLKGKIDVKTMFYSAECRSGHAGGRYTLLPVNLHSAGSAIVRSHRPNIFVGAVSPMDENGLVYFSLDLQMTMELMESADTVIFEVNPSIPRVFGETGVPIQMADYIYEIPPHPLPEAPPTPASPTESKIAAYVSSLIHDGDCIQLGIGGTPDAVGKALLTKQDLGIHTEMITSSMGKLMQAGAVTNMRKNLNPGKAIGVFAWGDQDLYRFIRDNPMVELRKASYTNDPSVIAQNDNLVSVNTAIEIDLSGQICSESIGHKQYTGAGGAFDFALGAYHSKGGRGIIAINSTAKNGTVSKIMPSLSPGAIVTIPRNIADYVITEYGIAPLKDRCLRQRVENLISIAHPDFRTELRQQAAKLMLW